MLHPLVVKSNGASKDNIIGLLSIVTKQETRKYVFVIPPYLGQT
jgi:hypothetical protein